MGFFNFLTRKQFSGGIAKNRLKFVLIQDRATCSDKLLERIKNGILEVLARYIDIDNEELDIQISRDKSENNQDLSILCANIPIKNIKKIE
ncbi:MAG: cell division topological specificity factor MinE [Clostridiales bacterium]|jgi:cell division topological specificity factor|nr:cell division topological specificity factor MinE [Clostridiales bacterium]